MDVLGITSRSKSAKADIALEKRAESCAVVAALLRWSDRFGTVSTLASWIRLVAPVVVSATAWTAS